MPDLPSDAEVLGYFDTLSNWGRWGEDDQLGTLNLITPEKRRAAAALVSEGITASCAWEIDPTPGPRQMFGTPQRYMQYTGHDPIRFGRLGSALEFVGGVFHGVTITHLDALCHIFWDGKMFNGKPAELVTASSGATHFAVTEIANLMTSRGVLLDIAATQGRAWLDPGEPILPSDLEAAQARQGVTVEPGDILFVRSGIGRREREEDPAVSQGRPGLHAAALPWLHEHGVALLGSDGGQEAPFNHDGLTMPVHAIGIVAMGMPLIDNCDLEELSATCERVGRWEFLLTVSPLRWRGATGGAVNPIALF